jgi:hypothetical protein
MCHVSVTVISEELEKKRHEGNNGYHFKQEERGTPNVHVFIQRVTPNKRRNICSYKPKTYYNAVSQKTHSIQDFNGWESPSV